ncbi:MAG: hypothetical protein WCK60_01520 [Candidatus Nomurabacteria bacterium]
MKSPEGPITPPSSHLEKKNEILETLRRQVLVIKGLLEKQQTLAGSDIETLIPLIDKEYDEAIAKFDETTIERYKVYKQCFKSYVTAAKAFSTFDCDEASEEEILKYENSEQRLLLLWEKIEDLCTPEISFIDHIEDFFIRIKEVARRTAEIRKDKKSPKDLSVYLDNKNLLNGYFSSEDVLSINEDAFSTAFFIKKEAWLKKIQKNVEGLYIPKTDSIFIQDGFTERSTKHTLEHERMHHMLDGISRYEVVEPFKIIESKFKRILNLKRINGPSIVIQYEIKRLFGHDFAKQMINSTQNEFLATYEEGKRGRFGHAEMKALEYYFGVDKDVDRKRSETFKNVIKSLSTAGLHIGDVHKHFTVIIETLEKEGLGEYLVEAKRQLVIFEDIFLKMIDQVNQANDYSKILGEGVDLEIKALLILLEPTSYHHIVTYLRYAYKDAMTIIDNNKKFFFDEIVNDNMLQQLCDSLKISGNNLRHDQRDQFSIAIKKSIYSIHNDLFLEESCDHPLKAIKLLNEVESVLYQGNVSKKTIAKEYLMDLLIGWRFDSKVFEEIPDNFFSGENNEGLVQKFISGYDFKDEFDDEKRQEVLKFFKRVGLY